MSAELPVGHIIDQTFKVERRIGGGAAGDVYEVSLLTDRNRWKLTSGTQLCLKMYKDTIFDKEAKNSVLPRRIREAVAGSKTNHPNLVKVLDTTDLWRDGAPQYIVMDMIAGDGLEVIANKGAIPIANVYRYMVDLTAALDCLHNARCLHRDVKSANIRIASDGRAVLLDLGVISIEGEATLTGSQAFLGTLRFASPEALFDREQTTASDVYSLGSVLYHMLTGCELFGHLRLYSVLVKAVENEEPKIDRADVDPLRAFAFDVARAMLQKNERNRPSLRQVHEFFEKQQDSELWRDIRTRRLKELLPAFPSKHPYTHEILSNLELVRLDSLICKMDKAELLDQQSLKLFFNSASIDGLKERYLSCSEEKRVQLFDFLLAVIYSDDRINDGVQIESAAHVAEELYDCETDEKIKISLKPILSAALEAERDMWRQFVQENPGD